MQPLLNRIGLSLACALGVFVAAAPSQAATAQSEKSDGMRFAVVRSNAPGCEPVCPEWISAVGTIEPRSVGRLKTVLAKLGKRRLPIVLASPGGDVDAAMAMGRLIRKNRLDVVVGSTWFAACVPINEDCKPDAKFGGAYPGLALSDAAECASACPLMLAGGTRRVAGPGAYVGVHQITTTYNKERVTYQTFYKMVKGKKKVVKKKIVGRKRTGSYTTTDLSKPLRRKLESYLNEMAINVDLLDRIQETPASSLLRLDAAAMHSLNLVTNVGGVADFTGVQLCDAVPAASNCKLLTTDDVALN